MMDIAYSSLHETYFITRNITMVSQIILVDKPHKKLLSFVPFYCSWTAITQLAHHGMLFVPIGYTFGPGMFKMDFIRGGSPYGAGVFAGDGTREPSETELALAEHQGKYMAVVVKRLAKS